MVTKYDRRDPHGVATFSPLQQYMRNLRALEM
jgi:hypothetical protein